MDHNGGKGGKELEETEVRETIIRMYFVRKESIFNKVGGGILKIFGIIGPWGNAIQNFFRFHFTSVRMAKVKE